MQSTYALGTPALLLPRSENMQSLTPLSADAMACGGVHGLQPPRGLKRSASDCLLSTYQSDTRSPQPVTHNPRGCINEHGFQMPESIN